MNIYKLARKFELEILGSKELDKPEVDFNLPLGTEMGDLLSQRQEALSKNPPDEEDQWVDFRSTLFNEGSNPDISWEKVHRDSYRRFSKLNEEELVKLIIKGKRREWEMALDIQEKDIAPESLTHLKKEKKEAYYYLMHPNKSPEIVVEKVGGGFKVSIQTVGGKEFLAMGPNKKFALMNAADIYWS